MSSKTLVQLDQETGASHVSTRVGRRWGVFAVFGKILLYLVYLALCLWYDTGTEYRRKGTYGIMTVGLGSQIYLNKSIYPIFNIFPVIYLVFIGIELKLLRFSKISICRNCCLILFVKFTGLFMTVKFHKKLRFYDFIQGSKLFSAGTKTNLSIYLSIRDPKS